MSRGQGLTTPSSRISATNSKYSRSRGELHPGRTPQRVTLEDTHQFHYAALRPVGSVGGASGSLLQSSIILTA